MPHTVKVRTRPIGSKGVFAELRTYVIDAEGQDAIMQAAQEKAASDGFEAGRIEVIHNKMPEDLPTATSHLPDQKAKDVKEE